MCTRRRRSIDCKLYIQQQDKQPLKTIASKALALAVGSMHKPAHDNKLLWLFLGVPFSDYLYTICLAEKPMLPALFSCLVVWITPTCSAKREEPQGIVGLKLMCVCRVKPEAALLFWQAAECLRISGQLTFRQTFTLLRNLSLMCYLVKMPWKRRSVRCKMWKWFFGFPSCCHDGYGSQQTLMFHSIPSIKTGITHI